MIFNLLCVSSYVYMYVHTNKCVHMYVDTYECTLRCMWICVLAYVYIIYYIYTSLPYRAGVDEY